MAQGRRILRLLRFVYPHLPHYFPYVLLAQLANNVLYLTLMHFLYSSAPLPLYSTLIGLAGYTYGPWTGAVISYWAALAGAVVVFLLSRYLLRETISSWLSCATSIKRVVRAIEKRPKLLFLIRLAPYPYNVMNCLLGASPTYVTSPVLYVFTVRCWADVLDLFILCPSD